MEAKGFVLAAEFFEDDEFAEEADSAGPHEDRTKSADPDGDVESGADVADAEEDKFDEAHAATDEFDATLAENVAPDASGSGESMDDAEVADDYDAANYESDSDEAIAAHDDGSADSTDVGSYGANLDGIDHSDGAYDGDDSASHADHDHDKADVTTVVGASLVEYLFSPLMRGSNGVQDVQDREKVFKLDADMKKEKKA